jgi:hypothetical protein
VISLWSAGATTQDDHQQARATSMNSNGTSITVPFHQRHELLTLLSKGRDNYCKVYNQHANTGLPVT